MKNFNNFIPIVGGLFFSNPYENINTLKSFIWRVYHITTTVGAIYLISLLTKI
jgi:hypothetical protein